MYGLQAISANNGWAMALAGAMIVFSGLIVLSFAISQLHKLLNIMDKKAGGTGSQPLPADEPPAQTAQSVTLLEDLAALAEAYQPLTAELDGAFQLADLYKLALRDNLPHPHLSIKALRDAHLLLPQGDGVFTWQAGGKV